MSILTSVEVAEPIEEMDFKNKFTIIRDAPKERIVRLILTQLRDKINKQRKEYVATRLSLAERHDELRDIFSKMPRSFPKFKTVAIQSTLREYVAKSCDGKQV